MKKFFAASVALLCMAFTIVQAQLDRSKIPGPGPAPSIAFPDYDVLTTANGIRVISWRIRNCRPWASACSSTGSPSSKKRCRLHRYRRPAFAHRDDNADEGSAWRGDHLVGGDLSSSGTNVYASGLSKNTEKLFELMSDITLHPSLPQDELEKLVTQTKSGLQYRKTDPGMIVDVVRKKLVYGAGHPYEKLKLKKPSAMLRGRNASKPTTPILNRTTRSWRWWATSTKTALWSSWTNISAHGQKGHFHRQHSQALERTAVNDKQDEQKYS